MDHLNDILNQLDLLEHNAVYFRDSKRGHVYPDFSKELEYKLNIIQPDSYFVFNKLPFILFFDFTKDTTSDREEEIHKQVWSFDHAPIIFIIKKSDVLVYNAFSYSKKRRSLEEITITKEERNELFSFWNLQSGATWKRFQNEYLEKERNQTRKRVNQRLFENIKEVREALTNPTEKNRLSEDEANTLILRLVFIRYLIDREVKIDERYISGRSRFEKQRSFSQLIETPAKLNELFDKLNDNFNGVLFKDVKTTLTEVQAQSLAKVFRGEIPEKGSLFYGTEYFFQVFDFSIIPVEVISGIYESLINEETKKLDSAVYTPSFLVDYILADTVEKFLNDHKVSDCKIFDPAVGSGIFLVQSLRKMIDKEKELNPDADAKTFSKRTREMAKRNLFGVDINSEALKVTCFSIYIALLDYQEPKDIYKYEFPNLIGENLFQANIFNVDHPFNEIIRESVKPDFILGNPPWKKDNSKEHLDWVNITKTYDEKISGKLEIAQSFLLRIKDFMQMNTKSALIVTSTIFYNVSSTAKKFKEELLVTCCIDKFFDLSPVRRLIFEKKNSPATIVYFRLSSDEEYLNNVVDHQSIKINNFLKSYRMLVIEKKDQKQILQRYFLENHWMFKTALYGNTLDFALLKRIKQRESTIENLINESETLFMGSGIKEKPVVKKYHFLMGKKCIENKEILPFFTPDGLGSKLNEDDILIQSGRREALFQGNQILIKAQAENESEILISYTGYPYVYKHDVFGISTFDREDQLKLIYAYLATKLYTYYQFQISGAWGTATRPAIRLEEYLSFPFIFPDLGIKNKLISLVSQYLKPFQKFYTGEIKFGKPQRDEKTFSQINEIVNDVYGIKGYEEDLINYVLEVSRYQFQESKQDRFIRKVHADKPFLQKYAEVYIQEFKKIYQDEYLQVEVYPLEHFIAMNFVLHQQRPKGSVIFPSKRDEAEILERLANNLTISKITDTKDPEKNLFIQKDIKGFEQESFYIIKPNEFKCWHRAMAWYDVAEFKEAIEKAELNRLSKEADAF